MISTKPGMNRYLRVTPGGLLRTDAATAKAEENLDGKYLLRTADPKLPAEDIALDYKQLLEVERGWRDMKQVIDLRPVYRRREDRIRAHVTLCWLALLLSRTAENAAGQSMAPAAQLLRQDPRRHLRQPPAPFSSAPSSPNGTATSSQIRSAPSEPHQLRNPGQCGAKRVPERMATTPGDAPSRYQIRSRTPSSRHETGLPSEAGPQSLSLHSGQQLEGRAVHRTHRPEVAVIQRCDAGCPQAFRDEHDRAHSPLLRDPRDLRGDAATRSKPSRCQQGSRTVPTVSACTPGARVTCTAWRAAVPLPAAVHVLV